MTLGEHMAWRRRHHRPNPALGIARDIGCLWFMGWSATHDDGRWLWLGLSLGIACFVYDVRLMWIRAGRDDRDVR